MTDQGFTRGLDALRHALLDVIAALEPLPATGPAAPGWLTADSLTGERPRVRPGASAASGPGSSTGNGPDDSALAASSAADDAEGQRIIALVELARSGDKEAFGQLYDHYHVSVYRFLYYRVGSVSLAEDLTSETFFRALRSMSSFRWQGKDFGAWLMTIARNLTADHFKSGRTRLEQSTEDMQTLDATADGPEHEVLALLTNEALLGALRDLPSEQRECLVMRFLQGLSIAETAEILGRSAGAVKQLQLRGVRNLAKVLPREAHR
ncbi:MAG TPA: sigma-70 family RNA polymerase sigma factor [Marmoricola sp.]|nr:sigma-70 family RNA polymerase sigma factor [Marmoricola sp.]